MEDDQLTGGQTKLISKINGGRLEYTRAGPLSYDSLVLEVSVDGIGPLIFVNSPAPDQYTFEFLPCEQLPDLSMEELEEIIRFAKQYIEYDPDDRY